MPLSDFSTLISELAQGDQLRTRRVVDSPQGAYVVVDGRRLTAFASNDYLGLAADPRVVEAGKRALDRYGVGAGAAHFVCGHMTPHHLLEQRLAEFMGMRKTIFFPSGYAANIGMLTALAGRGDIIFADKLNHACLNDGALLSRATFKRYAHGNMAKLRALLASQADSRGRKLIVTDAVFSMDGDLAPLPALLELAEEFDALLLIDDAHGFGVLGKNGRGSLSHFGLNSDRIVYMATLGKAAGVYGAFIAGDENVIEWILQSARTYLFTTATPPVIAAALLTSLHILDNEDERREQLNANIQIFSQGLKLQRWQLQPSITAIQPVIVGSNHAALQAADALRTRGFWVPAIRPPTVPPGRARLRISLSAEHTLADIMDLIVALTDIEAADAQPRA